MSLVNLANVCSHLQNASLARLGLTSIPYTKWHLSVAILLQRQGFLSQVKLGGASPPPSCFAPGPRDDHHVTNHPHGAAGRNSHSPEAALALAVRHGLNRAQLQNLGFLPEALDFAQEHSRRSLEELEADGWPEQIVRFIADLRAQMDVLAEERTMEFERRRDQLQRREPYETQQAELTALIESEEGSPELRRQVVEEEVLAQLPVEQRNIYTQFGHLPMEDLQRTRFDFDTIAVIAGRQALRDELDVRRKGITISAMGLDIPNQSVTLPKEAFADPKMLDAEGVVTQENRASRRLWLGLKYYESSPVLSKAKMISKPTKRIWLNSQDLGRVVRGRQAGEVKPLTQIGEIMAVSTDRGIMEARECAERKIGGMPLARFW
jgi:ribosomal protein S8